MIQQKSPGGNQGEDKVEKRIGMPLFYPSSAGAVNRNCNACMYFRPPATARRWPFCSFTGEPVTPAAAEAGCDFCIMAEVAHADI